jgi:acyl-coenzyme A synthetase/AMP-(fatty) acid ligase
MIIAPPILMFFQNAPVVEEYDLSSLRSIISVAAPASKALIENSTNRLVSLGANGRSFGP